jgi:hypothetical protein
MAKGLNWSKTEVPKNFENLNGQSPGWWSKTKFLRETLKFFCVWLKAGSDKVCKESGQRLGSEKLSSDTK